MPGNFDNHCIAVWKVEGKPRIMRFLRFIFIALAAGSTIMAAGATMTKLGVPMVSYPQGISLRQESVRGGHMAIFPYMGRSHHGGGMRGHK